ncbi:hypothetical protein C8A05DRAFT_44284 [Staphylotrichum tortipilum]|uniref:Myb-like domain-containing protein n=1 Tax=Staphylotrichum tortipilum TaxID=2831512 RepID=A0AAN6ML32_9PEZI|nr:hypothetical protein C8A05DRAFT_44284 [Staphylotrichum longicolle]
MLPPISNPGALPAVVNTRQPGLPPHHDDDAVTGGSAPELVGDETATLAEYPYSIYNHGTWTANDDKTLIQARTRGQNWADLQRTHFPTKTANACRKRYERLVERRGIHDYSGRRLETVANEYMNMRKEIWSGLADRVGMKWEAVESLCMGAGLRTIQSNARSYTNRARRDNRGSRKPREAPADTVPSEYLLAQFDRLVNQGMVVYQSDHRVVTMSDGGLSFEFHILESHTSKPRAPSGPDQHSSSTQPGCRPGSDIKISGYEIATLGPTHLLMVNKFPAARPHLLILTQDGFKRQYEALTPDDLTAGRLVLSSLRTRHLLLFNCGISGGCSRLHKHMQVLPAPDPATFVLWPDVEGLKPPFRFFRYRFGPGGLPEADELARIYRALLRRAERALGCRVLLGEAAIPHNVVLDRRWLVVIPRRAAGWEGADANAAGMLGLMWLSSEEKAKLWAEKGPAAVLARLGVPVDAEAGGQ